MNFFINTSFTNVWLSKDKTSRIDIAGSIRKVWSISSSVRDTLDGIVVGSKSVDLFINTFLTNILSVPVVETSWVNVLVSIRFIRLLSSGIGDWLDHVVSGSKSVDLFIDTFLSDVLSRLVETNSSEFGRVNVA
jgi:hypothetical protein